MGLYPNYLARKIEIVQKESTIQTRQEEKLYIVKKLYKIIDIRQRKIKKCYCMMVTLNDDIKMMMFKMYNKQEIKTEQKDLALKYFSANLVNF